MSTANPPLQEAALLLADGFYLLAHDALSGKPRLAEGILSLGLAGALLGELALAEKVSVRGELLVVTDPEPPANVLGAAVHQRLLRSVASRPVRDWLAYFADDSLGQVAGRMAQAGWLLAQPSRLGRSVRYQFADSNGGEKVALGLCTKALRRLPIDSVSGLLAGLMVATGLEHPLLLEIRDTPAAHRYLTEALALLSPPTLRELIRLTRAAVDAAVVSHRA